MQLDDVEERQQLDKGRKPPKSSVKEKIVINDNYQSNSSPSEAVCGYGEASVISFMGRQSCASKEGRWKLENVHRFKDLNKACPKDLYPLLEIDRKIESLIGFKYKCFLDAYKGYHQIHMIKKDEENTAFHIEEGVFCYTKMPFGLKNAGETYHGQTEQVIIRDVEQNFSTLRKINMKLNPKKCSFGMEERKFLGYVVTSEGIRANHEKTKDVMDMPSPRTLKQMQSLNMLKKCTKKKDFRWIEAAEVAFLEMKKLVSELPTLTTPKKGETLMMYLAASDEAVSALLLTKRDGRQMPINYAIKEVLLGLSDQVKGQILENILADISMEINVTPVVARTLRVRTSQNLRMQGKILLLA
ncbi:reverse transcriptase domain-containing protein [Tanacetum coccineum]